MSFDHGLGAVIKDGGRDAAEVGKGPDVTSPESGEVLASHKAGEGVAGVGEGHVEAVDVLGTGQGLDHPFVAPVHLGLGAGQDLVVAVKLRQLGGDAFPGISNVELHPLVGSGVALVAAQAVIHHRRLELGLEREHLVDDRRPRLDEAGLMFASDGRGSAGGVGLEVLLDGAPVVACLPGDLRPTGAGRPKGAENT